MSNEKSKYDCPLSWLADQNASFVLVEKNGKKPVEKDWVDRPHKLEEIHRHITTGGNAGLLCGEHSNGIIALDRDTSYPDTLELLGDMVNTAKVIRTNAPERGKLLYRITGTLPESKSFTYSPENKSPYLEILSTGRYALIPPSNHKGGNYVIIDTEHGIKELTSDQFSSIIDKVLTWEKKAKPFSFISTTRVNPQHIDFAETLKNEWSILDVFKHFGKVEKGTEIESNGDIRILGNGGLLITKDGKEWFCHSDFVGGDLFKAWAWCSGQSVDSTKEAATFKAIMIEMGNEKGLNIPNYLLPKEQRPNKGQMLADLLATCDIFTGNNGNVYARFYRDGHTETANIRSSLFSGYLQSRVYDVTGSTVSESMVKQLLNVAVYKASTRQEKVYLRVGGTNKTFYVDLCNSDYQYVKVSATGWEVITNPPVIFTRTKAMQALPIPVKSDGIEGINKALEELFTLTNIAPDDRILVLAWLLSAMRPNGPYPILTLFAEAGSAKTTTIKALKRLISPYQTDVRSQPKSLEDMFIAAENDWIVAYDNLSHLSQTISDGLCVIATGGGIGTRKLYEDSEESVKDVCTPQIIAGVSSVVNSGDLASRVVSAYLPMLAEKRMTESQWEKTFTQAQPRIMGALLSLSSMVIENEHLASKESLPRLADFAILGRTLDIIFKQVGKPASFSARLQDNQNESNLHAIEASPIWLLLHRFMTTHPKWSGSSDELLNALKSLDNTRGVPQSAVILQKMPTNGVWMARRLNEIASNLRNSKLLDILITRGKYGVAITIKTMSNFVPSTLGNQIRV